MNRFISILLYIFLNITILILFPSIKILLILIVLNCLVISIIGYLYYLGKREFNEMAIKRISDRIWDIPVELKCRHCGHTEKVDFSLETRYFRCDSCKGYNKINIIFSIIGETENSISDES